MKNIYLILISATVILFGYQNCEKPPYDSTISNDSKAFVNLANENIQKISFVSNENTTVQQSSSSYTLVSQKLYTIDFLTGEILKTSDVGMAAIKYCLSSSLLTELRDIINSSQVCKIETIKPSGQVCAAMIQQGYAQIITNRDQINLGSTTDGCGTNKIDLCSGAASDMLKGWFTAVTNQLPQLICL